MQPDRKTICSNRLTSNPGRELIRPDCGALRTDHLPIALDLYRFRHEGDTIRPAGEIIRGDRQTICLTRSAIRLWIADRLACFGDNQAHASEATQRNVWPPKLN
jgi:hypothetical protein